MVMKAFFGFIMCLFGQVILLMACATVQLCYYTYELHTDKTFISVNFPSMVTTFSMLTPCIYSDSNGDFIGAFTAGSGGGQFTETNNIFSGFDAFETFNTAYGSVTEPLTMTAYKSTQSNFRSFSSNDFTTAATGKSYIDALSILNNYVTCTNDKWVVNDSDCGSTTLWTNTDAVTLNNGATAICINIATFTAVGAASITTRYSGGCATANAASAQTQGTLLNSFVTSYQTLIDEYTGSSGSNGLDDATMANTEGIKMIADIKTGATALNNIKTQIQGLMNFIQAFSGNLTAFMNCLTVRRDIVIFSNTFCYEFVLAFADQSYLQAILGPLLFAMSVCMCCTSRCPLLKDTEEGNTVQPIEQKGDIVDADKPNQEYFNPYAKPLNSDLNEENISLKNKDNSQNNTIQEDNTQNNTLTTSQQKIKIANEKNATEKVEQVDFFDSNKIDNDKPQGNQERIDINNDDLDENQNLAD